MSRLGDWLKEVHHAENYDDLIRTGVRLNYYNGLEADVYKALAAPLDRNQQRFLGFVAGWLYTTSHPLENNDIVYFGFGSNQLGLECQKPDSDNVLTRSSCARATNCDFSGDYVFENAHGTYAANSRFYGKMAFRKSTDAVVENSETSGDDFGRQSRHMRFVGSTARGRHTLSYASDVKTVNSEFHDHITFCSSAKVAAFSPYVHCISNPRSGVIVADTIDHIEHKYSKFNPDDTKIFAVNDRTEPKNSHPTIKIEKSDIAGEWNLENLNDRLRTICRKYEVEVPDFL